MEQLLFHSGGNNLSEYFSNSNGVSFWYFRLYRVTLCFEHFEHFQTLSDYTELLFASNTSNTFKHFQIIQSYSLLRTLWTLSNTFRLYRVTLCFEHFRSKESYCAIHVVIPRRSARTLWLLTAFKSITIIW